MKYMKRVSAELETVGGGPEEEELIVQGVRFAFRVHQVNFFLTMVKLKYNVDAYTTPNHKGPFIVMCCYVWQFASGFDADTMRAFQELRDKARSCHVQCHGQQQKFLCRPAAC